MYSKIMVPVDLAHTGQMEKSLAVAADLAQRHNAQAHIVGVTLSSPTQIARTPEEFARHLEQYAKECSDKFGIPFAAHAEVSNDIAVDLDDVLSRAADSIGADLIVMASHVPGMAEYIFASNAGYLASHSSLSVFVVR